MSNFSSSLLPGVPSINVFPAVNTFSLAGVTFPGKWTLLQAPKKFGWEIRKGYGLSGAFVIPMGDELVLPLFKGEFWAMSDYLTFISIRDLLLRKSVFSPAGSGGALLALASEIDHPELKWLGCTSVVVGKVEPTVQVHAGLWETRVEFIQYRPPVIAPAKPSGSIPDTAPNAPVPANATQQENAQMSAEAAGLGAQLLK